MSPSEYQELVAFLGERFEVIDRRSEAIDRRFETIDRRFEAIDASWWICAPRSLGHFDALRRLERLEQEYAITQALRRIAILADSKAGAAPERLACCADVVSLQARIDAIERRSVLVRGSSPREVGAGRRALPEAGTTLPGRAHRILGKAVDPD
jgi:hypothetical protein